MITKFRNSFDKRHFKLHIAIYIAALTLLVAPIYDSNQSWEQPVDPDPTATLWVEPESTPEPTPEIQPFVNWNSGGG